MVLVHRKLWSIQLIKLIVITNLIRCVYSYIDLTQNSIPVRLGNKCDQRVNDDHEFSSCRARAYEDWSTYDRTSRIKYNCCFDWDIIDCQQNSVYNLCDRTDFDDEYKTFQTKKYEWVYQREKDQCRDYPYQSAQCRLQWWAIVLIVLASLVVIAVMVGICYFVRKRSDRLRARYSKTDTIDK